MSFGFSPSAGSSLKVSISSAMTAIKGLADIPEFGPQCSSYETTSIDDLAKSYGKDIPDMGKIKLTGIWDSTDAGQAYLYTSAGTPNAIESFEADFAKKQGATTAAKATFSATVLTFQFGAKKGNAQPFTAELQLSGPVTLTPAA